MFTIIMGDPEINQGVANLFKEKGPVIQYCATLMDLKSFKGHDTLILLDISGTSGFQKRDPEEFARNLIQHGLPKSVTNIMIVKSCAPDHYSYGSDQRLYEFADTMAKRLASGLYYTQVHCLNNSGEGPRFLIPPDDQSQNWQIYQIRDSSETHYTGLSSLKEAPNKENIETTPDILAYLNDSEKAYITKIPKNPAIELIVAMVFLENVKN